jgi:trigger factor
MTKVELKETISCGKKFRIEVERERLDTEMTTSLKKIKHQVQIPGFRKGKAPESLISKRFGSLIREEAIKDLIPKVLQEVFEEQGIKPIGEPEISDFTFEEASPITFNVTVEEIPQIDILGFERLKVAKEIFEVTDEDVDRSLERLRHMHAQRTEVDREAQEGDILVVNLQKMDVSGVPIIGEKIDNHVIALDGYSTPSGEFDKQVLGMKKGETRMVRFTYDESIKNPDLVGRTESYSVKVVNIIENRVPELNDEFAKTVGDYGDLNDLREKTRQNLRARSELYAEKKLEFSLINEFIKEYPFEVPNSLVEKVLQSELGNERNSEEGKDLDEEAFRAKARPDAVRAVQTFLILDSIKDKKNIEVTKEEINEELNQVAKENDLAPTELRRNLIRDGRFENFKKDIANHKAYAWMKEVASVAVEIVKQKPEESKVIQP